MTRLADTDQTNATTHPMKVQPKSRFRTAMDAPLWWSLMPAMIEGRK